MSLVIKPHTFEDNENVLYTDLNSTFDTLYNLINGTLDDANIKSSAGIDPTKIAGTASTLTGSENLTNKTLSSPIINTPTVVNGNFTKPTIKGSIQTLSSATDGATVTFDMSLTNLWTEILGGNRTLAVSNASSGQVFTVILTQDGTGSRTVTWWAGIVWTGSVAPTLTTTAGKTDIFNFIFNGTNYFGSVVGQNYG